MLDSGDVKNIRLNPANEDAMTGLLCAERIQRMSYPIGDTEAHLKSLDAQLAAFHITEEQIGERQPAAQKSHLKSADKPPSLAKQLREAQKRVDAQDSQKDLAPRSKRGERE
jgi:hypothetical protein